MVKVDSVSYRNYRFTYAIHSTYLLIKLRPFFLFAIFILHSRESDVLLSFERDVRTRLGVAVSEVFGLPVFHIKAGASS